LGEGLVADVECNFRDALVWLEEFFLGPFDPAAVDVVGEGQAGGFLEEPAEVGLAEAGDTRHGAQRQRRIKLLVDVLPGLGDRCGFAAFLDDREGLGVVAKLVGEAFQQGDHAGVALRFDRPSLEVGLAQDILGVGIQLLAADFAEQVVEILLVGDAGENLAGAQESDGAGSHADRHGGGGEASEAVAGAGAGGLSFGKQSAVGVDAGRACAFAQIDVLAEWTSVDRFLVEAPVVRIGTDKSQGKTGRGAKRILINLEGL